MAGSKEPFRSMPPGLFLRFFRWFCRKELREYIEGDLMELYQESRVKSGRLRADIKFAFDVVLLLRPEIIKVSMPMNVLSDLQMVRSYFKLGFRNLLKYKGHSLINIGGLSIGMAVAIMIGLWVADELNFNKSFRNYDRLGQLYHEVTFGEDVVDLYDVPVPIGKKLKESFAEFEDVAITSWSKEYRLGYKDIKLKGTGMFVEPAFLSMFSVSVLPKNEAALNDVRAIVLSSNLTTVTISKSRAFFKIFLKPPISLM
jgi:putative ABC transport system permease protein